MPDSPSYIQLYSVLLKSIDSLIPMRESLKREKAVLKSWTDFVTQNEVEIVKFGKVTADFQAWLGAYDFAKGLRFDEMQRKLQGLHPLRLKLVKMGEEARKLAAYPDRYNSKKAVEVCRNLTFTCMERMTLDETEKVGQLVDKNTQKLIELQKMFERDGDILSQIKSAVEAAKNILVKYKAYYAELQQYVAEFPHIGQDDLSIVKSRIATLKQIDTLAVAVDKELAAIRDCSDRYGKAAIVANCNVLLQSLADTMRYSDARDIETRLSGALSQIRSVKDAFSKELRELKTFNATLLSRAPIVWKDDGERLLSIISRLLNRGPERTDFDLHRLRVSFSDAKTKRAADIDSKLSMYPWLESNKRYKAQHEKLLVRYITLDEYNTAVGKLKRDKTLRMILWFIPVIGWIILAKMKSVEV